MKKLIALAAVAATLIVTAGAANAQRWHHRHRGAVIIEQPSPLFPLLGAVITAQILAQAAQQAPQQYYDPAPPRRAIPRYDDDHKAPLK